MKRILILTCSTGEGHNSAAKAIDASLKNKGFSSEIVDPVSFKSQRMKKVVSSLYNDTIRKAPEVFGAVYKLGDLYCNAKLPSPIYWANSKYADALKEYIISEKFDAVICTHLYGMEAMTAIYKKGNFHIPCFGVLTDYVCIPFIEDAYLTGFFVPNEEAKDSLVKKGIPEDKIYLTGIPVNAEFKDHLSREEARRKLCIPDNQKVYLVMTGGVGCENMESLCCKLSDAISDNEIILVMTGNNDVLRNKLKEKFANSNKLVTVPFTNDVATYMAASDVLLSKPGGLSSTEAAVANIPLVHIHGIPGCETYNADFFQSHGMSLLAKNEFEAVEDARTLANNKEKAENMRKMQRKYVNASATDLIIEKVCESWSTEN